MDARALMVFAAGCRFAPQSPAATGDGAKLDARAIDAQVGEPVPDALVDDPVALWEFDETGGNTVADTGRAPAMDLTIDVPTRVTWGSGELMIVDDVRIESAGAATKVIDAAKASNAVTVEAWARPANDGETGPARIVAISLDATHRNTQIGQSGNAWAFRLRTPATDASGQPDLTTTPAIQVVPAMQYLVGTEDGSDRVVYVDGVEAGRDHLGGSLAGWDETFKLILANDEVGTDRAWHGTLARVAIYDRVFSPAEVKTRFQAGP